MAGKGSRSNKRHRKNAERLAAFKEQLDKDLLRILVQESERGCVLVGASFIEEALEHLIRSKLFGTASDRDDAEWLLSAPPIAPLGSFHAKIVACSALGIISTELRDALMSLKTIRNSFAHRAENAQAPSVTHHDLRKIGNAAALECGGLPAVSQILEVVWGAVKDEIVARGTRHAARFEGLESPHGLFLEHFVDREVDIQINEIEQRIPFIAAVMLILKALSD